jgi:beta-N-acetylhexosaminidase
LLIATNHEGDKAPYNQIRSQLTKVPNNMAIGATWQPQYAETVGEIVGQELSIIGINMLLGPSLDVLEEPAPYSPNDLGTRSFGGDPYWVGEMGQAYTRGVHNGSQNRMAVVAKHFPGIGSSDRPIDQEVPTVRKSQEQLKQIELAPFFAVTGGTDDSSARADALLATHIRYQGFQGNIRATTNPISFDPQALTTLMQLPQLASWRQEGGVIVSDALGVRAVERFYDDTQGFPHRRVAKDALLAGNDLLILAEFALGDAPYEQQLANIKNTILWFREKYETDQSFQQRVDEAVLRILQLKLRLYGEDFSADNVLTDAAKPPMW